MNDNRIASVLKSGIASFGARGKSHEDALLDRILAEVEFEHELGDDVLELLSAAGDLSAMQGYDPHEPTPMGR